jgi:transposase InsO family protein
MFAALHSLAIFVIDFFKSPRRLEVENLFLRHQLSIRDRPISPGSPWQNPYAERLVGTVRRECVDRVLIFGEAHLRQILSSYVAYYNEVRTHLALGKDAPAGRAVQRSGTIIAIPILSGLHHHYVRM